MSPPTTPFAPLRRAVQHFAGAREGNIATIFALALIPMLALVGAAVDYSRASAAKADLQSALDSTALMVTKNAASYTAAELQSKAQSYFVALFDTPEAKDVQVTATYSSSGGSKVVVTGSAELDTEFLGVVGWNTIQITGTSTTKWGSTRLRVALVLDNTGSMADSGKIAALKTATQNLLTQLQNAATTNGDVYVSIIPFVKDVNLGAANWNSDYIYWGTAAQDPTLSDNNSWDANNGSCSAGNFSNRASCVSHASCSIFGYNSQSSCQNAGTCSASGYYSQSSCQNAGTCSISGRTSQSSCQNGGICTLPRYSSQKSCNKHGGTWTAGVWTTATWTPGVWTAATWTPDDHSSWNGCVMDRGLSTTPDTTNNYDTNVVPPDVTKPASLYAAEQYNACPQSVMGLSYDWSAMNSLIDNMSPNGNTNQAIGLQLGWMSLVGEGPFAAPAMDPNYTYSQVIILLTDGLNTQDRWYTSQSSIDARQQLTCNNIKAAGITLYTIQVNTGGDPTSTLLQNCASTSDKFFLLTSANQIVTTFNQIGTNLSNLYIAK